jgi:hypothetical protein
VKYWHEPFHAQVYGVGDAVSASWRTADGGKYTFPSMRMMSDSGASAMTVPFSVAVGI